LPPDTGPTVGPGISARPPVRAPRHPGLGMAHPAARRRPTTGDRRVVPPLPLAGLRAARGAPGRPPPSSGSSPAPRHPDRPVPPAPRRRDLVARPGRDGHTQGLQRTLLPGHDGLYDRGGGAHRRAPAAGRPVVAAGGGLGPPAIRTLLPVPLPRPPGDPR